MTYNTRQKELILGCLKSSDGEHMTADDIMLALNSAGQSVGKSTVYRYLDFLLQQGLVRKYSLGENKCACYSYVGNNDECKEHFHLQCSECGKLIHLDCDYMNELEGHIKSHHGFSVDNTKTVLYGRCADCEKKHKDNSVNNSDNACTCSDSDCLHRHI